MMKNSFFFFQIAQRSNEDFDDDRVYDRWTR